MTKQFCDRCGADITGKKSAAVHVIDDADETGNGRGPSFDLCSRCAGQLKRWIKGHKPDRG